MLAQPLSELPKGEFFYEPKWDGFRAVVFRTSEGVTITSRDQKDLTRYFPELAEQFQRQLASGTILDGEIVVVRKNRIDFAALQQRIHPAQSRIDLLAHETPASFIAFDLIASQQSLVNEPFHKRRRELESMPLAKPLYISKSTRKFDQAKRWFESFSGGGVDGIVAKASNLKYLPDQRVMYKIKHFYSADCVVAGYRPYRRDPDSVGALLLGLYDENGVLQYVGSCSSFKVLIRRELASILQPLLTEEHPWLSPKEGQRVPGALSRWSGKKDLSFIALDPRVVCEVRYDQLEGERFRHATTFLRWRVDRVPYSCTFEQLVRADTIDLRDLVTSL